MAVPLLYGITPKSVYVRMMKVLFLYLLYVSEFGKTLSRPFQQTGEIFCVSEILYSLMYARMVLMVLFWRSRRPIDAHSWVSRLMNVTFYAKKF